jgi:hypothetical protein
MADYTFLVDNTPKELPNPVIDVFWDRRNLHKQHRHTKSQHTGLVIFIMFVICVLP